MTDCFQSRCSMCNLLSEALKETMDKLEEAHSRVADLAAQRDEAIKLAREASDGYGRVMARLEKEQEQLNAS